MKRLDEKPLIFPIGETEYTIPPVGIDAGWELINYLSLDQGGLEKSKLKSADLFKLALSDGVWEQMRADNVPSHLSFKAGMAALAHFQVLAQGGTSEAALIAAEAIWESGIRPEALAAWVAAKQSQDGSTTSPRTAKGRSSTRSRASTSGTKSPATSPAKAKPLGGGRSRSSGR